MCQSGWYWYVVRSGQLDGEVARVPMDDTVLRGHDGSGVLR